MSKKNGKKIKSTLTKDQKEMGKTHVYIIIGMIIVGLAIAAYNMHLN